MFLKMEVNLTAENITMIRHFFISMLAQGITNEQQAHEIAMASTEILENVSKFSAVGGVILEMEKQLDLSKLVFTVKNVTTKENFDSFKAIFETITKGSSDKAYRKMMIKSVDRKNISQLGLIRVRHECNAELSYSISSDISEIINSKQKIPNRDELLALGVIVKIPIRTRLSESLDKRLK